ncbi:putative M23 family metallopeptidase [Desulfovibrionales bacterium]
MFFNRYLFAVFQKNLEEPNFCLHYPDWLPVLLPIILGVLFGSLSCLIIADQKIHDLQEREAKITANAFRQRDQLLLRVAQFKAIQAEAGRTADLSAKLRIMLMLDKVSWEEQEGLLRLIEIDAGKIDISLLEPRILMRALMHQINFLRRDLAETEVFQQQLIYQLANELAEQAIVEKKPYTKTDPSKPLKIVQLPTIWPCRGRFSSGFGFRGHGHFHKGIDLGAAVGTPIFAPADGIVTQAYPDGAYGNLLHIHHGSGVVTHYAHLKSFAVRLGQIVKRRQIIGYVGMTGRTTGAHLHYEVEVHGKLVNPRAFILN